MEDVYILERGDEVPEPVHLVGMPAKYPFRRMEVGRSFLVRCGADSRSAKRRAVTAAARNYRPMRFRVMQVGDGVLATRIE